MKAINYLRYAVAWRWNSPYISNRELKFIITSMASVACAYGKVHDHKMLTKLSNRLKGERRSSMKEA